MTFIAWADDYHKNVTFVSLSHEIDPHDYVSKNFPKHFIYTIFHESPIKANEYVDVHKFDENMNLYIDITAAKQFHLSLLRNERQPLLKKLDLDFIIALENGDDEQISKIKEMKRRLRDVTIHPLLNEVNNIEDLKSLTIERLCNENI